MEVGRSWWAHGPIAVFKAWMMWGGRDPSDDGVANHEDLENRVPMGQQGSTPPPAAATSSSGQGTQIQRGWGQIMTWGTVQRVRGRMFGWIKAAIMETYSMMLELNGVQSEDHEQYLKRLVDYTKKVIPFESLIMGALCNNPYFYSSNTSFKICLVLVLLAFFADILSALLLQLKLFDFLIKYLVYTSSVTQMLVPFFLFVSSGQLQPYMILTAPLPFFSATLLHQTSLGAGATIDGSSALDHNFDMSAWIYALSAGCALISPNIISLKLAATSPSACSLFLTIFIARYLMLITTLRPPVVINQVETLMNILKLLWGLTVILFILDHLGWKVGLAATTVIIVDAALFSMPSLLELYSSRTNGGGQQSDQKNQQLLWAVIVSILFMALTQTYSEHVAAHDKAPLGSTAIRRLLLYFGAFLWSLNRMLITPGAIAARQNRESRDMVVTVWYALEYTRGSVVVVAALDMMYKFGITFITGSS
ncbi:unnamed protein product [Urochloa decumbens]|uniref:Uncharacterized protein n=1 Tax=Urochloa decumbens TaxID=240449 RepID=A0ABC9BWX0_9POAL